MIWIILTSIFIAVLLELISDDNRKNINNKC